MPKYTKKNKPMRKPTIPLTLILGICLLSAGAQAQSDREQINALLDNWHQAAAVAEEETFVGSLTEDGVYIGTDKTERWTREEMRAWAKPYFERDTAWAFTPLERKIYFDRKGKVAWFNETLDTWMGVCRASGVLEDVRREGWKISHYHLSVTIDNDLIEDFISLVNQDGNGGKEAVAAEVSEELREAIKQPIIQLFEAMRKGDGQKLLDAFAEGATLHTATLGKDGKPEVAKQQVSKFVEAIAQPHEQVYNERIADYKIRVDGNLASVWTPYEFFLGEKRSHCGVNAFQLVNTARGWKILHITDTRYEEKCP